MRISAQSAFLALFALGIFPACSTAQVTPVNHAEKTNMGHSVQTSGQKGLTRTEERITPSIEDIEPATIESILEAHQSIFDQCHRHGWPRAEMRLPGFVRVDFEITTYGRAVDLKVTQSSLKRGAIEKCILQTLQQIDFSPASIPAEAGTTVHVTYPFRFAVAEALPVGNPKR
jgi:TonB family protein